MHSSVGGHLCCFHVLDIVNSAVMTIGVHMYIYIYIYTVQRKFCLDICPGVRLLDQIVVLYLVF